MNKDQIAFYLSGNANKNIFEYIEFFSDEAVDTLKRIYQVTSNLYDDSKFQAAFQFIQVIYDLASSNSTDEVIEIFPSTQSFVHSFLLDLDDFLLDYN